MRARDACIQFLRLVAHAYAQNCMSRFHCFLCLIFVCPGLLAAFSPSLPTDAPSACRIANADAVRRWCTSILADSQMDAQLDR
jgi:hypothetical protein